MDLNEFELVIFDADGTLRECTVAGQFYPLVHEEWKLKDDVCRSLRKYDWSSKKFGIATNQPGISRGEFSEEMSIQLLEAMVKSAFGFLPEAEAMQFCPHHIDGGCECRKPAAGMLQKIMNHYGIAATSTVFIGDSPRDKQAAENACCHFLWVDEFLALA